MLFDTECVALIARTERNRKVTIFFPVIANLLFGWKKYFCLCGFIVLCKYYLIYMRGLKFDMGAVFITMTEILAV